jgi:hypothetical protein
VVSFRPRCFGARLRTPRWVPADKVGLKARSACDDGSIKMSVRPSADRSLYKIDHPAVADWRAPLSESLESRLANAVRTPVRFEVSRLGRATYLAISSRGYAASVAYDNSKPPHRVRPSAINTDEIRRVHGPANKYQFWDTRCPSTACNLRHTFGDQFNARRDVASAALTPMLHRDADGQDILV